MIARWLCEAAPMMGIALTPDMREQFALYHRLMIEGNAQANLTRIVDAREVVDRHFLDSLGMLAQPGLVKHGASLIDIGSGAGLPGVPLLIARPDLCVTLCDAQIKRVRFLEKIKGELGLSYAIVHARAEDIAKKGEYRDRFDIATARAVASTPTLMEWLLPFVAIGGLAIGYKGRESKKEKAEALLIVNMLGAAFLRDFGYNVPGRNWERVLLVAQKHAGTPQNFPRKAGIAQKSPIIGEK